MGGNNKASDMTRLATHSSQNQHCNGRITWVAT